MLTNNRHLDAGTVAAFCARALDREERSHVFEHLAGCAACREWLALTAGLERHKPRRSGRAWTLIVPVAAAIVCAVVSAWFLSARASRPHPHPDPDREIAVASYVQVNSVVAESAGGARHTRVRVRPHAERTVHLPAGLHQDLPLAWQGVTLASTSLNAPAANQISLRTTLGEKWITIDGLWEPGTGVR